MRSANDGYQWRSSTGIQSGVLGVNKLRRIIGPMRSWAAPTVFQLMYN